MTKEQLEEFIESCKAAGLERWALRFEGGNRTVVHGNEGTRIVLRDEDVVIIEPCHNYASDGVYNITLCTYDMIDNVRAIDTTFLQSVKILEELGVIDDDLKQVLAKDVNKRPIIPGTAGLAPIKDADGRDVVPSGSVGYVTR